MSQERVQKILAKAGIASRRKAEELITEGLVTINGKVATLGEKAEFGKDAIKVKGKLISAVEAPVYIAVYKPRGVISMMVDPEGRPTLADVLGKVHARVFPIGRLDFSSEGLILMTNDGEMAEKLQKADQIARVYHVKVKGHPDAAQLANLKKGAKVGHKMVRPHSVTLAEDLASKSRVEIVMIGHGAVDIKALFELKGFLVESITRTAIGHLTLRGLKPGLFRQLEASQVQALLDQPELGMKAVETSAELGEERLVRREAREEREERREALRAGRAPREGRTPTIRPVDPSAPRKPRFGSKFGGDRKPGFGSKFSDRKPRFGSKFGDGERKPRFNSSRDESGAGEFRKPRFGGEDRKPRFGSKFGGEDRPKRSDGDYGLDRGFGERRDRAPRGGKGFARGPKGFGGGPKKFGGPKGFGRPSRPKR